jgi:DNA helicase-2/ATP-dependent DNA helicase PcrA
VIQQLIDDLNPAQKEAVTYLDGPLMIVAGAGSGKTRVITYRIAYLAREIGIPLGDILAVTFTNKAAREMRERVLRLLQRDDHHSLPIGTFHSRCAMILRSDCDSAGLDPKFQILDDKDQIHVVRQAMKQHGIDEKKVKPRQIHDFINVAKMRLQTPDETREEMNDSRIPYPDLYASYEAILTKNKCIDIEDLIFKTVLLFRNNDAIRRNWAARYQYLLVDEYQDTNHGQFLLTKMLAQDHGNIAVVGDEDQAIYSWRGADITNLLDFEKSFPKTRIVRLEQNYRSTANILKAAGTVIRRNTQRLGKTLFTDAGEGDALEYRRCEDDRQEGLYIAADIERMLNEGFAAREIAVFYRTHRLSRAVEDGLRMMRVPYRIIGGIRFYDRAEVKDVLSFLRLAVNPSDDIAFERVVNVPKRGVGEKALENIRVIADSRKLSLFEATWAAVKENVLSGKAKAGVFTFVYAVQEWNNVVNSVGVAEMLARVLEDTNYRAEMIGDEASIDGAARVENLQELDRVISDFVTENPEARTSEFLSTLALDNNVGEGPEENNFVSLLSIHNAKGLEYRAVYLIGLDEGVFPNSRAISDLSETGLEEERRLFYVAITRARERLCITRAARRQGFSGMYEATQPSRFLSEMPADVFSTGSVEQLRRDLGSTWVSSSDGKSSPSNSTPKRLFLSQGASTLRPTATTYERGMRVEHRYMGAGEIYNVSGRPGAQRIHIRFDTGREQSFVASHAPITIVSKG